MSEIITRNPYASMVEKAKKENRYELIDGEELDEIKYRVNQRAEKNIARIDSLERKARAKSAKWVVR